MSRRFKTRRIKSDKAYRIGELADATEVSSATVRARLRSGMGQMDDTRPTMIMGFQALAYLNERKKSRQTLDGTVGALLLALQGSKATAWWHDPELELFGDSPMDLDIFSGPAGLFAAEFGAIFELYIAYFNRAPDALGLLYWGTRYAEGHPLSEMANDFFNQDETKSGRLCAPPATAFGY